LIPDEVEKLLKSARENRYGVRDHALLLAMWTHGLRVVEALWTVWPDFDLERGIFHVRREKGSLSGDHPLRGVEIRALRQLKRDGPTSADFVFASERGGQLTARGVQLMVERLAVRAGLGSLNVHPHMFRHSCGYYLAERGQDLRVIQAYLGHANIRHTVRYTHLSARKFQRLWDD
jgi:type 1 fimbriae regulatory protein FimB/type 1 fimbriae regulatory protein FimE